MKFRTILLYIIVFITIDQVIKIVINAFFVDYKFDIISSFIEFKPTFNDKHSYVNVLLNRNFGLNIGLLPHIFIFLVIGAVLFLCLIYLKNNIKRKIILLDTSIIFLYAGICCAFIGNLIWKNGTLDYIYLKPLFVFDLKDVYLDLGIALFFIYTANNWKQLKHVKTRDIFLYARKILSNKK